MLASNGTFAVWCWYILRADVSGMPILEAFAQVEQQRNIYDVVHIKYYDEVWLDCIFML